LNCTAGIYIYIYTVEVHFNKIDQTWKLILKL